MPTQKLTKSTTQSIKGGSSRSKNKQKYQKGGVMPDSEFLDKMGDKLIELHNMLSTLVSEYTSHISEKLAQTCEANASSHDNDWEDQLKQQRVNQINKTIDEYVRLNGQGKDTIETLRNTVKNCKSFSSTGYDSNGGKTKKKQVNKSQTRSK
jgi:hypothetical protein